jgi:hypothetical protein
MPLREAHPQGESISDSMKRINDFFKAGTERLWFFYGMLEKPMIFCQRDQDAKQSIRGSRPEGAGAHRSDRQNAGTTQAGEGSCAQLILHHPQSRG